MYRDAPYLTSPQLKLPLISSDEAQVCFQFSIKILRQLLPSHIHSVQKYVSESITHLPQMKHLNFTENPVIH